MKIIVGLGNIGPKYHQTRHNIGFMVVNELVRQIAEEENREITGSENNKLKAFTAKTNYKNSPFFVAKPTTLMNRSGQSIIAILNFFKAKPEDLAVIYDDIDLALGTVRIRHKGSAGTHNGMKSIIEHLGTQEFTRIRIGIESRGDIAPKDQDLSSFVLEKFTDKELQAIKPAMQEAVDFTKAFILKK